VSLRPFVLVHGGQHGGWCWREVAAHLRAAGADVFTPTLTGVGERAHLLSREVGADTVVADIVNLLECEELDDAVLVGHSFGGLPITGAADQVPERIAQLVYLDAVVPGDGQSAADVIGDSAIVPWLELSQVENNGLALPLFFDLASALGVTTPEGRAWLERRLTPHPTRTYTDKLRLQNPIGNGIPATYLVCTEPMFEALEPSRQAARDLGWPFETFPTGHDAMVIAPDLLATALLRFGNRPD
jgi:pimeloyl-ACP methyl ester carboxylesterase